MLTAPVSSVNLSVCKKIGPLDPSDGPRQSVKRKKYNLKMCVKFGGFSGAKVKPCVKKFKKKYLRN
jgi:hypothetical protein